MNLLRPHFGFLIEIYNIMNILIISLILVQVNAMLSNIDIKAGSFYYTSSYILDTYEVVTVMMFLLLHVTLLGCG